MSGQFWEGLEEKKERFVERYNYLEERLKQTSHPYMIVYGLIAFTGMAAYGGLVYFVQPWILESLKATLMFAIGLPLIFTISFALRSGVREEKFDDVIEKSKLLPNNKESLLLFVVMLSITCMVSLIMFIGIQSVDGGYDASFSKTGEISYGNQSSNFTVDCSQFDKTPQAFTNMFKCEYNRKSSLDINRSDRKNNIIEVKWNSPTSKEFNYTKTRLSYENDTFYTLTPSESGAYRFEMLGNPMNSTNISFNKNMRVRVYSPSQMLGSNSALVSIFVGIFTIVSGWAAILTVVLRLNDEKEIGENYSLDHKRNATQSLVEFTALTLVGLSFVQIIIWLSLA